MEYDENDFQSQNFQLVGEDNKFSANLRAFALPKFDLDEHLRFGSLVETEVLLGIQGQENNWIGFPSGSTAVEFSSSAAESCSISRHNNVWSEATSSESVDLLLKSVGEDEIITEKAIIMESSVNDGSDGLDNQVDLYVKKDDTLNSSVMDALPTDEDVIVKEECPKGLSSPSEGQSNLLTHFQVSSQASEVEESRTIFNLDPSNGISSEGNIAGDQYQADENPTSSNESIEKSGVAEKVLCETVLKGGHVFDVLLRTNDSNIDDCNSCVVASHSSLSINCRSNQDERLVMDTTGYSDEQNQLSVRSRSDFLHGNDHKEKSMAIHSVETNNQLVPKTDALEVLRKCSDSVISEDADGFVSISCRTEPLIRDGVTVDRFFEKEDGVSQFTKQQGKKFEDNSGDICSTTILKMSLLTERYISDSGGLPDDSVEDDDVYNTRNQNSTMSSDDRGQKLVTCLETSSNKQNPKSLMTENNIPDAYASNLQTESKPSIQVNYETKVMETSDHDRINNNPLNITCEKNVYVVDGNTAEDMDVDNQEMKLDADKDISLDESSLLSAVLEAESKSSPCTFSKEGKPAVNSAEVHVAQVDVLVNKKSAVTCTNFGRVSIGMVSNVIEKVQDSSPADLQMAEELPLDSSSGDKLVQKEFDSIPLPLDFEKSMHYHLPPPEDTTDTDLVVEKKEPLIEAPSTSDVFHSADKDAAKLDIPVKSATSQFPQGISSFNLALEQKEESSSSSAMQDLFENEVKLSGSSKLTHCSNGIDKETVNGVDAGSDCVEDALVNISTKNEASAVVQPPSLVKSIDFIPVRNASSAVDADGNGESVHLEGTEFHGSGEGIANAVESLEGFSHVRNETSDFSAHASYNDGKPPVYVPSSMHDNCSRKSPSNEQNDQCNIAATDFSEGQNVLAQTEDNVLVRRTNDSSQICTASTFELNPSEKQSGNPNSSDNCRQCPQDNLDDPEVKDSLLESNLSPSGNTALVSSAKDETAQKLEFSNNDSKTHGTSVKVRSFTFEASNSGNLAERGIGSEWKTFTSLQSNDIPQILKENPQGSSDEVKAPEISAKTPNKGKTKNAYRPYNEKKKSSRGKTKKEAPALKQSSEMNAKYSSCQHKYAGTSSKDLPLVDLRENTTIKTSSCLVGQTSSIPDLNSSSSTLFQQSFTDLQQVQLRAQIFVYGALISGIPPDEAYMVSAFGDADGGRRSWEGAWHALIAKFQNPKSSICGYETPSHSLSVGTNVQSKVPGSSAAKGSGKIISSSVQNSTAPFPSPLWSLSYGNGNNASMSPSACLNFNQTASPLTPWRPSQLRQHVDASSPWFSRVSHPGPWFVSSHSSALDGIKNYSTVPFTETMHATCASDLCGPHIPTIQVAPASVSISATDPASTTTEAVIQLETTKKRGTSGSNKHTSRFQKARKMKGLAAEELNFPVPQTLIESNPVLSGVESLPFSSTSMLLSSNSPVKVASGAPVSINMSHIISPTHYQMVGENNNQRKLNFSEETCSKMELAKLRAEDAAAVAASSIKHCQAIWSQLAAQKNSGLVSQIEEKLASAAVAAAAAASVAKAAAAAAKVASDVAWQAKIMADEAISAAKTGNTVRSPESGILDVGKKLAGLTPISILKGMEKIHGSVEVISAAREAAKRRIESASAATKQAENLDAIVKAAELAAEAVAQVGTIIAMGDPLPFTLGELVDAGTDEFWKVHHGASMKDSKLNNINGHELVGLGTSQESAKQFDEQFLKDVQSQKPVSEGESSSLIKCHEQLDGTVTAQGNFATAGHESDHSVYYSNIQKGSIVEVMSDEDGLRGAWFSAKVLDMKDNKAYVCYNDFSTSEGQLKEWIVLENERDKPPRIRVAPFATTMRYEGTRKRRREHLGSYIWELGDRVDAWMHDRWWEGTIAEKSSDDTKLTMHLLAKGDKLVVDAWNVRPSFIWKDGQWMDWRHSREKLPKPHEGDTPQEKRQKLVGLEAMSHSEVVAAGIDKLSKNMLVDVSGKPEDSRSLILSAKGRTFSIGKNSREEITSNSLKTKRSGLQKEGSRVVFGVPRPGKKRKFMEVSKHYVADKCEKVKESNDPIKFAKYLMPQASHKFKNTSKVDNKRKKPGDSKSRVGVKTENSLCIQARSQTHKDDALLTALNGEARHENAENLISSVSGNSNNFDKMNTFKFGSSRPAEITAVESVHSVQPAPTAILSKKKNVPGSESDLAVKAKPIRNRATEADKVLGNHGKAILEAMEPRRSNRRIQPTSRLLEGIQSSLIISKMPSVSQEKKSSRGNVHG